MLHDSRIHLDLDHKQNLLWSPKANLILHCEQELLLSLGISEKKQVLQHQPWYANVENSMQPTESEIRDRVIHYGQNLQE